MEFPYKIIESRMTTREEFVMTDGCQPTHALFFLKKGCFVLQQDGEKEEIKAGDCVILPDYVHFRRKVVEPIEFVYIKFATNRNCPYTFHIPFGKVLFRDHDRFIRSITNLENILDKDDAVFVGYRDHLLMDILFQIHFEQVGQTDGSDRFKCDDTTVIAAAAHIAQHISDKLLIDDICVTAGTNPSTLNLKFRREFAMSVGQYIMNERMKKARHLLASSTYPVCEIAQRCGFENVYYFSNAFKKHNGVSPTNYRVLR